MEQAERLQRFVKLAFGTGDGSLVLYVMGHDHTRAVCSQYPVTPDVDDCSTDTYEEIESRALSHANTLGGTHAFCLEWVRVPESGTAPRVAGHEVFRVSAEAMPGTHALHSEPANEGGLLAQTMRHQEASMKMAIQASQQSMVAMERVLNRVAQRAEIMEQKYSDNLHQFLEARWATGEQEIAMVKAQGNAQAKAQLAAKLGNIAPAMLGRVVEHFGRDGTAVRMRGFVGGLSQEQIMKILQQLEPEQQALLLELIRPVVQEMEAEQPQQSDAGKGGVH